MTKKILYISYDGLTDQLGQSQIIPYLIGLAKNGYKFHVLSCEKKNNYSLNKIFISNLLVKNNIDWHPIFFSSSPPFVSKLWDVFQLKRKALQLNRVEKFHLTHCRSYVASLIGLWLKKKYGTKFVFDMRGFWADERAEGNIWNIRNPLFKIPYRYFKRKEKEFLANADFTISLTEAAKKEILVWDKFANQPIPIKVIPCCVDTDHFSREKIDKQKLQELKKELDIRESDFILSYIGSLGTWYMLDEMICFFSRLLIAKPNAKILFITPDEPEIIFFSAKKYDIPSDKILIQKVSRALVPLYLSLSNVSVFFYKPGFSRSACSPVKHGELMSMGIPVICNAGVGDTDWIIEESQTGIVINKFSIHEFDSALKKLDRILEIPSEKIRNAASDFFSLQKGVELYDSVYKNLLN